ncbi:hypothetical protein GGX14DRAFT_384987 [Mycena pura]|uniref:Uncharacterized protein n=1 Tax=Mycena pura TaxID=153505 RepID=A0AAD6VJK4_9AGAR|nr:hypothetical protein GGX14DRAFT_395488 [Mycena pura]KAJ7228548.1 hypothetical protein GGX14DRAFT_384987 [Mycena pura]
MSRQSPEYIRARSKRSTPRPTSLHTRILIIVGSCCRHLVLQSPPRCHRRQQHQKAAMPMDTGDNTENGTARAGTGTPDVTNVNTFTQHLGAAATCRAWSCAPYTALLTSVLSMIACPGGLCIEAPAACERCADRHQAA